MPTVAVLAVQGAFIEHERALERVGARTVELRQAADMAQPFDAVVLPGGESTVQAKLLRELGMLGELRRRIQAGMPVMGTCAGLILLAELVEEGLPAAGDPSAPVAAGSVAPGALSTLPVTVRRNAYGRQLGSFHTRAPFAGIGGEASAAGTQSTGASTEAGARGTAPTTLAATALADAAKVPMTFIRAPFITEAREDTEVLAQVGGRIVAVRSENQLGMSFHPELDDDLRIHELFVRMA